MATIFPEPYDDKWTNSYDEVAAIKEQDDYVFQKCLNVYCFENKSNNVEHKLKRFIEVIHKNYKGNHYHNFLHALHVFNSTTILWENLCDSVCFDFTPIEHLALLISALVHDVEHPGGFNSLLFGKDIAIMYNDQSILENNSLTFTFQLLQEDEYNFLINMSKTEIQKFRKTVIDLVLGTDIGNNVRNAYLNSVIQKNHDTYGKIDTETEEGRMVTLTYILRCADVCAAMQSNSISWIWAERFYSECYVIFNGPPGSITDTYTNQIIHIKNNTLKLVQQIIRLKVLNQQLENTLMRNITSNLTSWKKNAQSKIIEWKEKLKKNELCSDKK
jgi:hypothetical protein